MTEDMDPPWKDRMCGSCRYFEPRTGKPFCRRFPPQVFTTLQSTGLNNVDVNGAAMYPNVLADTVACGEYCPHY